MSMRQLASVSFAVLGVWMVIDSAVPIVTSVAALLIGRVNGGPESWPYLLAALLQGVRLVVGILLIRRRVRWATALFRDEPQVSTTPSPRVFGDVGLAVLGAYMLVVGLANLLQFYLVPSLQEGSPQLHKIDLSQALADGLWLVLGWILLFRTRWVGGWVWGAEQQEQVA